MEKRTEICRRENEERKEKKENWKKNEPLMYRKNRLYGTYVMEKSIAFLFKLFLNTYSGPGNGGNTGYCWYEHI